MARARVLIVERWEVIGETLEIILRQNGYDARVCFTGQEAIEITEKYAPDAVIIELILNDMLGVELAKQLKRIAPKLAVILYGGMESLIAKYNEVPASAPVFLVLQKPLRPQTLLAELRRLLDRHTREFEA